jgi:hypothetical protein
MRYIPHFLEVSEGGVLEKERRGGLAAFIAAKRPGANERRAAERASTRFSPLGSH